MGNAGAHPDELPWRVMQLSTAPSSVAVIRQPMITDGLGAAASVNGTSGVLRRRRRNGVLGIMELPVVAALVVGHTLGNARLDKVLQSLGEASKWPSCRILRVGTVLVAARCRLNVLAAHSSLLLDRVSASHVNIPAAVIAC